MLFELYLSTICGLGISCKGRKIDLKGGREQRADCLLSGSHFQKSDFAFVCLFIGCFCLFLYFRIINVIVQWQDT